MVDDSAILEALNELDHLRANAAKIEAMAAELARALVVAQDTVYAAWAQAAKKEEGAKNDE